jgi:hypothetical protein
MSFEPIGDERLQMDQISLQTAKERDAEMQQ